MERRRGHLSGRAGRHARRSARRAGGADSRRGGAGRAGGAQLSYGTLARRAAHLAGELESYGVAADGLVGVMLERSLEMVVGLWGILAAGAGYLPIDPESPAERTAYLLDNANRELGLPLVVTQARLRDRLPDFDAQVLCLDTRPNTEAAAARPRKSRPGNLAYVIYTSGSTGKPKGVMISNRSLVNRMVWITAREPTATGTWLQRISLAFDVSVAEVFGPLASGGRWCCYLQVPSRRWHRCCATWHATKSTRSPSYRAN